MHLSSPHSAPRTSCENRLRVENAFAQRCEFPRAYPLTLFLEPTNQCNLQCPLCPTGSGRCQREQGNASLELVDRIFSEVSGRVEEVGLGFYGEPCLHPQLVEIIKGAKSHQLKVKLYSNLTVTPVSGWQEVVASGLDHIVVSVDGVTDASYGRYRHGGSLAHVINNLEAVIKARSDLGRQSPIIEAQMLAMRHNVDEWPPLIELCEKLSVDVVKLKYLNLGPLPLPNQAQSYLPQDSRYTYYGESGCCPREEFKEAVSQNTCKELYLGPVIIAWNGDFMLCCRDPDGDFALGSVLTRSIWEFWNGKEMGLFRRRLRDPALRPTICTDCPALFLSDFVIERRNI